MSGRPGVGGANRKIRVAVVGAGEFGRNHARVYREIETVELAGVLDLNAARAQAVAQEFAVRAFQSIDELQGAVDAASVSVPTVSHADVGCLLMAMGLDVLVEKPVAATVAEADTLLGAARRLFEQLERARARKFRSLVFSP